MMGDCCQHGVVEWCRFCDVEARLTVELSQALGLLDAAHVYLDSLGVDRCDGAAVHDRMARYVGTVESQLADAHDVLTVINGLFDCEEHPEEQARLDAVLLDCKVAACATLDGLWKRAEAAEAKLAAAEQREAEKDKALRLMAERWQQHGAYCDTFHATMGGGWKRCAEELQAALASPSTPSPAPSPDSHTFTLVVEQALVLGDGTPEGATDAARKLARIDHCAPSPTQEN